MLRACHPTLLDFVSTEHLVFDIRRKMATFINYDAATEPTLLNLPDELLQHILSYLAPCELVVVASVCQRLCFQSYDDRIWRPLVNENLPQPLSTPAPLNSFRELYIAHHPHWFLVKNRFWFADTDPSGKLIVARYDPATAAIVAHSVVATRGQHSLSAWEKDASVFIHDFTPIIGLDLNVPVLKLNHDSPRTRTRAVQGGGVVSDHDIRNKTTSPKDPEESLYSKEILMENFNDPGIFSSFALARALPDPLISAGTQMWPPLRFPAASRTRNSTSNEFHSAGHRPTAVSHVSQSTFRLRKWAEYTTSRQARGPQNFANGGGGGGGRHGPGSAHAFFSSRMAAHLGAWGGLQLPAMLRRPEDVTTYATLRAADLLPTAKKPYQGIWVGDYSGHGCELLVIRQPDPEEAGPLPEGMDWLAEWFAGGDRRRGSDSSESFVSAVSAPEDLLPEAGSAVVDDDDYDDGNNNNNEAHPDANGASSASVLSPTTTALDPAATGARDMLQGFIEIPYRRTVQEVTDVADAADLPSGRLEAIKLTGDVNIPRGEYTFIAPEIGPGGFMRVADEETFAGARIVRSAGHLAGRGFVHGLSLFPFLFFFVIFLSVPVFLFPGIFDGCRKSDIG